MISAHCTDLHPKNVSLRAGSAQRDNGGILIKVVLIFQHPKYNRRTYDFDCSILTFEKALVFGSTIQPVKLPQEGEITATGTSCFVSGFGMTEKSEFLQNLLVTQVQIIDRKPCAAAYINIGFPVTPQMICAGKDKPTKLEGNNDACTGDSVRFFLSRLSEN